MCMMELQLRTTLRMEPSNLAAGTDDVRERKQNAAAVLTRPVDFAAARRENLDDQELGRLHQVNI